MSISKLEANLELKTCAVKFLEIFSTKVDELTTISPHIIQSVEILSGDLGTPGFVFLVNYTLDGKAQVAKAEAESINLLDLSMTFKVIEGDLLEEYKSFKFIIKLSATIIIGGGSIVYWTLEYEKPNQDTPHPQSLMHNVVLQVTKDVDAFLANLI